MSTTSSAAGIGGSQSPFTGLGHSIPAIPPPPPRPNQPSSNSQIEQVGYKVLQRHLFSCKIIYYIFGGFS